MADKVRKEATKKIIWHTVSPHCIFSLQKTAKRGKFLCIYYQMNIAISVANTA